MTTLSTARFYDPKAMQILHRASLARLLPPSQMFLIKLGLGHYRTTHSGSPIFDASQGDGGASLGGLRRHEILATFERLLPLEQTTAYGQPNGDPRVRGIVHNNYLGLSGLAGSSPDNIVLCAGGRSGLQRWYQAIHLLTGKVGNIILTSSAPWISYPHGMYINGFNLGCTPDTGALNFKITPDGIDAFKHLTKTRDRQPVALVITTPDNPTGSYYGPLSIVSLIEHAYRRGIRHILIDLMYQMVIDDRVSPYDWHAILSVLPKEVRQCVTLLDGLTKSVGASNCRAAFLWVGNPTLAKTMTAIASHTDMPSVFAEALMEEVYGYSDPSQHAWVQRIVEPTTESRNIFKTRMTELGHLFTADQGYYGFVDISRWLGVDLIPDEYFESPPNVKITRINTVDDLIAYLAQIHGIAVVPGTPFLKPNHVRFSIAQDPLLMPAAIARFHGGLTTLPR